MISVVIALFNKERYILRALNSVFNQTMKDFELIVIDDGSTDRGAEIVSNFNDSRIVIIQQDNAGVSAARNRGVERANSELIAFLDADDAWRPEFLETVLRLRDKYPKAGAYATGYEYFEQNGAIRTPILKSLPAFPWEGLIENYFISASQGEFPISASSVCIPKYVLAHVGQFTIGEKWGEDLDMWCKIALTYPIAYSTRVGATYYRDTENRACHILPDKEFPVTRTLREAIDNWSGPANKLYYLRKYLAWLQVVMAKEFVLGGKCKEARRILRKCKNDEFALD
jgi:glycosyltransferase involved in cell wall biosynthesis